MKVSEFLITLDPHEIYQAESLAADFREQTGLEPCWRTFTVAETRKAIRERGLGGSCPGKPGDRVAWGHAVAEDLADRYGDDNKDYKRKLGRGSVFWAAVGCIRRAEDAAKEKK